MTTPRERIETDLKTALKAGEKEKLGTLRLLLTEIKNEQIRQGQEVDEKTFVGLVRRAIKQRHESATQYRQGGREETAQQEEREAAYLEEYLPQQAPEEEIRRAVEEYVATEGLAGPAGIGAVMKAMLERFGARADGGTINRIAKDVLTR